MTRPGPRERRHAGRRTQCRAFLEEAGQVLPFTVILVLLFSLLVFGFMGAAVAEGVHGKLQGAADAAALAAADQAVLWEAIAVRRHRFVCFATKKGWDCYDASDAPATVRARSARLFPYGWVAAAGCQYRSDAQAGVPPTPDPATICDRWRLRAAGFEYPPGSDPQAAAAGYFMANTARLRAYGLPEQLTAVRVNPRTGAVQVTAQALETGNPLDVLLHRPVMVRVRADARPHLTGRLAASGP